MCNDITGPTGLLAWVFTPAQWAAIPGISAPNAAGVIVVQPIYDILTAIAQPPPGAPAATSAQRAQRSQAWYQYLADLSH